MDTKKFAKIFDCFNKSNKRLWFVGGCVRDSILGKQPKDYDFTTTALPVETTVILSEAGFSPWPLGEKFGTIAFNFNGQQTEITTLRKDITAGRHPEVQFSNNLEDDLGRRDFTFNSMAMTADGAVIDLFDGQQHIKDGIIKTTGSPWDRFSEDPLRMLRAVRFSSQLGFDIDWQTAEAIKSYSGSILGVSRERWLEEMSKLLLGQNAYNGLSYLATTNLLNYIIPEMFCVLSQKTSNTKHLWEHIKTVVHQSPTILDVRWAALFHDMAKPQTMAVNNDQVSFHNHERLGAVIADSICLRFKMSTAMRNSVVGLVALHQQVHDINSSKSLRRIIKECESHGCSIENLIALTAADCTSNIQSTKDRVSQHVQSISKMLSDMTAEQLRPRLPSGIGNEIAKKFNLLPGPEVGRLKERLTQMLDNEQIRQTDSIEDMLSKLENE